LWRLRHKAVVPYYAVRIWLANPNEGLSQAWDIALGDADVKMKHWYTMAETEEYLLRHRKDK
jgi:hypothetical protein